MMTNKPTAFGICLFKKQNESVKILLCKSVASKKKWGFVKGGSFDQESPLQTATREFYEETSITIPTEFLKNCYIQNNEKRDIGIFLVNFDKIIQYRYYFKDDTLLQKHLSWENSFVKFFELDKLPPIKKNQKKVLGQIKVFLQKE